MDLANVYARIQNTKSTGVLKSNYVKTPVWNSPRRFAFCPIHIYLWKVKVSPPERSGAAEEISQMLAWQPLQRTEGEPLASRLIGTKLETSKIPFFLTGWGKNGKVSRATFLRESIPGVNQYVTFLLPQYRVRNEMPNCKEKQSHFGMKKLSTKTF